MEFKKLFSILIILISLCSVSATGIYSFQNSNVINLNPDNWDTQITKSRAKEIISFVHFYKPSDSKSMEYKQEIESMSTEYDGMFKYAAINCYDYPEICSKNDIKEYPSFKIFPPLPAPVFPYEGDIKAKTIISALGRFVDNKVNEIHSNNIDEYMVGKKNIPKIFLFTDKEGTPLIFKVLATQFDKRLQFGIVRKSEEAIVSKYKVKKFPFILAFQVGTKKPVAFDGALKFRKIYDFVNVYAETFFKVGEDKTKASDETKADRPWLSEKFPELNKLSANDVCFKAEGILCVVLISNGKPDGKTMNIINDLQNYLSPKIDRGIKYKFGWVNTDTQTKFVETVQVSSIPQLLLVNPGKRKRFYKIEDAMNMNTFETVFEKLASGDIRFKMFPGNEVPEFAE